MTGGVIFHTWEGPGKCYPQPGDPSSELIDPSQKSRWLPFRDPSMTQIITSGSPSNRSGQDWGSIHAGVRTAEEQSRQENFKF